MIRTIGPFLVVLLALGLAGCPELGIEEGTADSAADSDTDSDTEGPIRREVAAMRERLEGAEEKVEADIVHHPETPAPLPFDLRLTKVEWEGAPGLHSFAAAVVESGPDRGKWVLLGGRTNGLHNLVGTSFPESQRNTRAHVVDPATGEVCSSPLNGLRQNLYDAVSATNHLSAQDGDVLWIDGGYGFAANAQDNVTFGYLIAVDVPGLARAVLENCGQEVPSIERHFSHGSLGPDCELFGPKTAGGKDPGCALALTGGGMELLDGDLYLAFGQRFGGRYNDFFNQQQIYGCQVARLAPPEPVWGGTFAVGAVEVVAAGGDECPPGGLVPNDDPFHRRDLNVMPAVYAAGGAPAEALFVFGGVFRLEFFAFSEPIYVTASGVTVDQGTHQRIGQYEAGSLSLFDARSQTSHAVILGGISDRYCTEGQSGVETPQCTRSKKILSFPGFVEDGTILSCQGGSEGEGGFACAGFEQFLLYRPYAVHNPDLDTAMLGANAVFLRDPDAPAYDNDVLKLERLPAGEYTHVGWIYGGIEVSGKVPGQPFLHDKTRSETKASSLAFTVEVRPL